MRILKTPRLVLRPLALEDAPALQAGFPKWEVVRYLDSVVPWPYPDDGALTYIRDVALPGMQRGEEWYWSIRPRMAPEKLIGVICLRFKKGDNRGFWLEPAWQGQGLMAEACDVVTNFWFEDLGEPVLQAVKAVANRRSRRISERSSMRMVELMQHDFVSGRLPAEVWEITREEWFAQPGTGTFPVREKTF
jgi:[ribosomal protein S5]-alanine N-acetyltransferase